MCDECGLSELQRCHYNYDFLNLVLDELMPWHKDIYDFSHLEVNRYLLCYMYMFTLKSLVTFFMF